MNKTLNSKLDTNESVQGLTNSVRTQILEAFIDLYAPDNQEGILHRMPLQSDDPDGSEFEQYFTMIQTLNSISQDFSISSQDKRNIQEALKLQAFKFGYPKEVAVLIPSTKEPEEGVVHE